MSCRLVHCCCSLLLLYLPACGSEVEAPTEHYFHVEERDDGVLVATTSGVPKYEQPLFEYEEILHLQQDESIPESILYRPGYFKTGEDGYYYIVDGGDARVLVHVSWTIPTTERRTCWPVNISEPFGCSSM